MTIQSRRSSNSSPPATSGPRRINRRRALSRLGFTTAAIAAGLPLISGVAADEWDKTIGDEDDLRSASAESQSDSASVEVHAGVALLQGWMTGEVAGVPISDPSWRFLISEVGNYGFYAPPDWSFSETYDQTPRGFDFGYISTTQSVSPENDALFMVYDFFLFKDIMQMDEFIEQTLDVLAGDESLEIVVEQSLSFFSEDDARFTGVQIGDTIATMQTFGTTFSDAAAGIESSSYSSTIQIATTDRFDDYAIDYFFPMISNFQRFSGGGGDETPTPSPTP